MINPASCEQILPSPPASQGAVKFWPVNVFIVLPIPAMLFCQIPNPQEYSSRPWCKYSLMLLLSLIELNPVLLRGGLTRVPRPYKWASGFHVTLINYQLTEASHLHVQLTFLNNNNLQWIYIFVNYKHIWISRIYLLCFKLAYLQQTGGQAQEHLLKWNCQI